MRLLLISNSTQHGGGYLEHCAEQVRAFFAAGGVERVLFVPFALADLDGYAATARAAFAKLGLGLDSLHEATDRAAAVRAAQGFFVGGGNTFRLLHRLRTGRLLEPLRARVVAGAPYLGTSAGSNLACPTVRTTNDMPIVEPGSFDALRLVSFQINPHYLDPQPDLKHMGETRETRIKEFHEENDTPVVGLREGGMVLVDGSRQTLLGPPSARVFRRGEAPIEVPSGGDLTAVVPPPPAS
ncbi:MAG: dipeptidase PepE [Planctomycetes bacterium]|nr:dipeptidase PepE [Planctomycetota bacterium]